MEWRDNIHRHLYWLNSSKNQYDLHVPAGACACLGLRNLHMSKSCCGCRRNVRQASANLVLCTPLRATSICRRSRSSHAPPSSAGATMQLCSGRVLLTATAQYADPCRASCRAEHLYLWDDWLLPLTTAASCCFHLIMCAWLTPASAFWLPESAVVRVLYELMTCYLVYNEVLVVMMLWLGAAMIRADEVQCVANVHLHHVVVAARFKPAYNTV